MSTGILFHPHGNEYDLRIIIRNVYVKILHSPIDGADGLQLLQNDKVFGCIDSIKKLRVNNAITK